MINQEELAICKRRGHNPQASVREGWIQCRYCGTWLREVMVTEERADEPPEDEINPLARLKRSGRYEEK